MFGGKYVKGCTPNPNARVGTLGHFRTLTKPASRHKKKKKSFPPFCVLPSHSTLHVTSTDITMPPKMACEHVPPCKNPSTCSSRRSRERAHTRRAEAAEEGEDSPRKRLKIADSDTPVHGRAIPCEHTPSCATADNCRQQRHRDRVRSREEKEESERRSSTDRVRKHRLEHQDVTSSSSDDEVARPVDFSDLSAEEECMEDEEDATATLEKLRAKVKGLQQLVRRSDARVAALKQENDTLRARVMPVFITHEGHQRYSAGIVRLALVLRGLGLGADTTGEVVATFYSAITKTPMDPISEGTIRNWSKLALPLSRTLIGRMLKRKGNIAVSMGQDVGGGARFAFGHKYSAVSVSWAANEKDNTVASLILDVETGVRGRAKDKACQITKCKTALSGLCPEVQPTTTLTGDHAPDQVGAAPLCGCEHEGCATHKIANTVSAAETVLLDGLDNTLDDGSDRLKTWIGSFATACDAGATAWTTKSGSAVRAYAIAEEGRWPAGMTLQREVGSRFAYISTNAARITTLTGTRTW